MSTHILAERVQVFQTGNSTTINLERLHVIHTASRGTDRRSHDAERPLVTSAIPLGPIGSTEEIAS